MSEPAIPTLEELRAAYAVTRKATLETPLLDSPALAERVGARALYVKAESLQRAGSFKIRGAYWRVANLTDAERRRGVIAYSSGNFAQGLAAAGRMQGVPVTIVMPEDAPEGKRRGAERYGAEVVLSHHGERPREEAASELAVRLAEERGLTLLHPFDDPLIVAGQAAAGLEALEQLERYGETVDLVACCAGGGGLVGGVSLAFHYLRPEAAIVACEPEGYDGLGESLRRAELARVASGAATLCDALQATAPGAAPFAAARLAGARGVAVSDAAVRAAMRAAFDELKLVLEPSGAAALAAVLEGLVDARGAAVLVYATGGNVSAESFFGAIAA